MRISIVVPNQNQAPFLQEALASVFESAQGLDVECIVVDGGSTDGSVETIRRFEDRLAYWCSEPDSGQYDALNKGFARTTGEIMAWLNSDDRYLPWTLATIHSVFEALPEIEWLTTNQPGSLSEEGTEVLFRRVPGYSAKAFADRRYVPIDNGISYGAIQQESTFWRRSLWSRSGGRLNAELRLAGDFELWSRYFKQAELYSVEAPLATYRLRPGQRGADIGGYMEEAETIAGARSIGSRLVDSLSGVPVLGTIARNWPRYSAPVVSGGSGTPWSVRRVRFG